jgi:hypothetical protein
MIKIEKRKKRRCDASLKNGESSTFIFVLPHKLRKQMEYICIERGIELSEFVRESIRKNNENYKYLIRNLT